MSPSELLRQRAAVNLNASGREISLEYIMLIGDRIVVVSHSRMKKSAKLVKQATSYEILPVFLKSFYILFFTNLIDNTTLFSLNLF